MSVRQAVVSAFAALLILFESVGCLAVIPQVINYQGIVTDAAGVAVNGAHDLTFRIYPMSAPNPVAGPLWVELHEDVQITGGLFNVVLGTITSFPAYLFPSGANLWLSIAVDLDPEMSPWTRITSVPWAFKAAIADSALNSGGAPSGWTVVGNNLYSSVSGNVGIGVNSPLSKLHVAGAAVGLPAAALYNEDIAIDDSDAVLGLYSTSGGGYGSAITLGEIAEGALTNKWSIFRTTGASSRLTFSFGSDPSYAANAPILSMRSTGVGIGTTAPARKLEISDAQAYMRLTSSSYLGSVLELKSTSTTGGTWDGRINFLNSSDAVEGSILYYSVAFMDQPGMIFNAGGFARLFLEQLDRERRRRDDDSRRKARRRWRRAGDRPEAHRRLRYSRTFRRHLRRGDHGWDGARHRSGFPRKPQNRRPGLRPLRRGNHKRRRRDRAGARNVAGRNDRRRKVSGCAHRARILLGRRVERPDRTGRPAHHFGYAGARDESPGSGPNAGSGARQGDDAPGKRPGPGPRSRQLAVREAMT